MIKKLLIRIGILLFIAFLLYLAFTIPQDKGDVVVQNIEVSIDKGDAPLFIKEQQLIDDVKRLMPRVVGSHADSIDLQKLEKSLRKNALFEEVNIFYTTKGALHINVKQRNPFFIVSTSKQSYYITRANEVVAINRYEQYTLPLMVVHGNITVKDAQGSIYDLMTLIAEDPFWNTFFTSLYVTSPEKELIAQTRIAELEIKFGSMQEWKRKLWQLRTFLDKVTPLLGWGAFHSIYLEYPDRVITVPTHKTALFLRQDSIFSE